jgi:hypothetical protein
LVAVGPNLRVADRIDSLLDHERFHVRPPQPFEHLVARENLLVPVAGDIGICVPTNEEIDVFLGRSAHRRQLSSYSHSPFLVEIFVHDRAVAEHRPRNCQVSSTALRRFAGALSQ